MSDKFYPKSELPIRTTSDLLPQTFQTEQNKKFFSGVLDPLVQPGVLDKITGYIGRRYGKTYKGSDVYLDSDNTLRSRYQLEPGTIIKEDNKINKFYDYLDFKNQIKFFGNDNDRDDKITKHQQYSWNPPIDWDKFINYREYYWLPLGPEPVAITGQSANITSTYRVTASTGTSWIFSPDGLTNNPSLTLFRGQTYKFIVNSPDEGFVIRSNYDTGSLTFDTNKTYFPGELAVVDGKLWKALNEVSPLDGSTIDINSQDWELVDSSASVSNLDYNEGIENNGVTTGTLTFTVPYDAPDVLYYQSSITPDRLGTFILADIESNTFIDVENEVLGKTSYTSSNNVEFTNGLVVEFRGNVTPEQYAESTWIVEGVGSSISLTAFSSLVPPSISSDTPEVLFDNEGFDTQPFDDAEQFPVNKDYITVSKNSKDLNPWSRYNRWFHRSVIEYSAAVNGNSFNAPEDARAKRPIIEFQPNIKLFNHGAVAKTTVDYIDTQTTDVFSNIEGSLGYSIDGEFLFEGARVLVVADNDNLSNNKIYEVKFITHNGARIINLKETLDSDSLIDECVLVRRGTNNAGLMYHYNGISWIKSQSKTKTNQAPLFDAFDANGVSFSDQETYPVSLFEGCKIFSYKEGSSVVDTELGFSIDYLNIDNVGDIQFQWNWDIDSFEYTENQRTQNVKIQTGFYKIDENFDNGWVETDLTFTQPIIDATVVSASTNEILLSTVDWDQLSDDAIVIFYLNDKKITQPYDRAGNTFTFSDVIFEENDVVSVKVVADIEPESGYYQIPDGLEKNPLNNNLESLTLGQAIDHISSALEFKNEMQADIIGSNNLRDLADYRNKGERFIKHSGIPSLSINMLCDKEQNIIKSLKYAKQSYTSFKNNFLELATTLDFEENVSNFVDTLINRLSQTKTTDSPFIDSDMIGSGAFTSLEYKVVDEGIKIFSLSENFDLETLSNRAVYVYLNDRQLLHNTEYTFDSNFGFVKINVELARGDTLLIKEYVSTSYSHIPPTPTSLGLYKKFTPIKFIDDTYVEPKEVIQGHDGSLTLAYGDFRDDLLLELEYRIYNNIKVEYDPSILDIDGILGGYYESGEFSKSDLDAIVSQEFLNWVSNTGVNYAVNQYFDSENAFTYTYSNMTDFTGKQNLPGYWRGVYNWIYDTHRPHTHPWEILGFSEKPNWWDDEYGESPYTSGNLLLWEDIRDGVIRQGPRAGRYIRYARPSILNHIPVDEYGQLLDPLSSGFAKNFTLVNNQGSFKLGDVAPVEYAWRSSSEWPFAIIIALSLLKPFDLLTRSIDRSSVYTNILGQITSRKTNTFLRPADIQVPKLENTITAGLINYLASYIRSLGKSVDILEDTFQHFDVALSSRLNGFVDKTQQKYLLDSKSPSSSTGSIFIPAENYDIIFNVSSPFSSVTYSGVIVEKTSRGWIVNGYDNISPFFTYFEAIPNQKDPIIEVGGTSEQFTEWTVDRQYNNGTIILYRGDYYRAISTHSSEQVFDPTKWNKLPNLPLVGSVQAQRRRNFNRLKEKQITYGHEFNTIQQVVDFLLGYEEYLKSIGFIFDGYDSENQVAQDWTTSSKEFMFWTKHNWAEGSIISLSPCAEKIQIKIPVGVVDNLLDSFYDYNILKGDGTPLNYRFIDANREFQTFTITTTDTNQGIYFLKTNYVFKEHVVVFDDRTVFNDVIYDKPTGYRQERIKNRGFRTVDWDGDYTSPGFLFDNVNIVSWQPFRDYKLGDIVSYRSLNWVSKENHTSSELFNDTVWSRLDSEPEKRLVPNFDYRITQFNDYFETGSEGVNETERKLARNTIGYQDRNYLAELAEDSVTQYRLYQGFIGEKGTNNALTKVFTKLSDTTDIAIDLKEEWAFKVGELGGTDQIREIEFRIDNENFQINPQPMLLTSSLPTNVLDQFYRITQDNFTIAPIPFNNNIFPVSPDSRPIQTAGYVKVGQTRWVVRDKQSLNDLEITEIFENDHIWVTFDGPEWSVYRFNQIQSVNVESVEFDANRSVVQLYLNKEIVIESGEFVGIKNITNLTGFFEVVNSFTFRDQILDFFVIELSVSSDASEPEFDESTLTELYRLTPARFSNYSSLNDEEAALLDTGDKLWIDNNGFDKWEVIEKNKQFDFKQIEDFGLIDPAKVGTKVVYNEILRQTVVAIPDPGFVVIYTENNNSLSLRQILSPPSSISSNVSGIFAEEIAISPDSRWLAVGSPRASGIESRFKGLYNPAELYSVDDIVLFQGKLWKALQEFPAQPGTSVEDSTWIGPNTEGWGPVTSIKAESNAQAGYTEQGVITLYEYINNQWTRRDSFVSPRPNTRELFGHSISIGVASNQYYMVVSAPGAEENRGRVYVYINDGTEWKHAENVKYRGIYEADSTIYYAGDIVWYNGDLYECIDNSTAYIDVSESGDLSSTGNWLKLNPVATQNSLPQSISVEDDGSTLQSGILNSNQLGELIKIGDRFGTSIALNYDASILVVGAPFADGQYFPNYRGIWRPDYEYTQNDTVKWQGNYYQLTNTGQFSVDSTIKSFNEEPEGLPWIEIGDSSTDPSGKVFVYRRSINGNYELQQTISAENFENESGTTISINTGDELGSSVDIDYTGTTIVASSPKSDMTFSNQGSAYILKTQSLSNLNYKLSQKIQSFEKYPNEFFGFNVSISPDTSKIAVGANNALFSSPIRFDSATTVFDSGRTSFTDSQGFSGAVYVYELKDHKYFLTEKLEANLVAGESFGYSVDCSNSVVAVGSPQYFTAGPHGVEGEIEGEVTGTARLFKKDPSKNSWEIIEQQADEIDITKIKSIELYDNINNIKIQSLDYIDPAKLKIKNEAEQELNFKTSYDPAVYTIGTEETNADPDFAWTNTHVGELWWDLSTAKWIYYEQGDLYYRTGNWGVLAEGASVDVYEWVESVLLPSEWSVLADTNEGVAQGISGQPLYPDDTVYSEKILYNEITFEPTETLYYYWVRNKAVLPNNASGRKITASSVANLIRNPSANSSFIALADTDKAIAFNFPTILNEETALLNFEFYTSDQRQNAIHKEYQLISEGVENSLPTESLENKWIDSLVGYDILGKRVPDTDLPAKQKYGVSYRPRQSMFVNRYPILETTIKKINTVLQTEPFANTINFENLNLVDPAPDESLNLYDLSVENLIDLDTVGTVRVKQAVLRANLIDGSIDTIEIVDSGYGYKVPPRVEFEGDGIDAEAIVILDNQGRVSDVNIINSGKKYSTLIAKVRNFSVLVESDNSAGGFWSIYAWDDVRKSFFRSRSQSFDTTKYWDLVDWWANGYSANNSVVTEINTISEEFTIDVKLGDLIRIKEYGSGGWAVFERVQENKTSFSEDYFLVGRQNGTIELSAAIYSRELSGIGFDNANSFDNGLYDIDISKELRNIFRAVKEDIYQGTYLVEWNKLFFTAIRYVFAEQSYVDWAFKTSFLNAVHNVGPLQQKTNYKNDNLENYRKYIDEIKPYKTTIREYTSRYNNLENSPTAIGDFDLPAVYSQLEGRVVKVDENSSNINQYPWKLWLDNGGYSITDIQIAKEGSGYVRPPTVIISGDGTGANAQSYISNGKVIAVRILNPGSGYTFATVTLVGGNEDNTDIAKAVPVFGNSFFRNLNLSMKFDRYTKEGLISQFNYEQQFVASGNSSVFDLNYAPTRDKSKIFITLNGQPVLDSDYTISLYTSTDNTYSLLKGKVNFKTVPQSGDLIEVVFDKNDELLDSVNRINKYYSPTSGMIGSDVNQLMTGIDFGGVQVQGTTFDVTGGWDALPWFTDSWDSVEASSDYYVVADGSTTDITLPYVPEEGQQINIYLKRYNESFVRTIDDLQYSEEISELPTIRIDDINFGSEQQTNDNALMPTFVGDGSTNVIEIGEYVRTNSGDILIFRNVDSDGSVTITDRNIVDTNISGGTLSAMQGAYITANGKTAEEITIDGDTFISPDQVPAPEEQIPGQVLDSLSMKVYTSDSEGSVPLLTNVQAGDNSTVSFDIGQTITENNSVIVYVDKTLQENSVDYSIDFINNTIVFESPPTEQETVEVISLGVGGTTILDYQFSIADGNTRLFFTNARYNETSTVFVTVNGIPVSAGFSDSEEFDTTPGNTVIQFAEAPANRDVVQIVVCAGEGNVNNNLVRINQQIALYDGSSRQINLDNLDVDNDLSLASVIVQVNNVALRGIDTRYFEISDNNLFEVIQTNDDGEVTAIFNEYRFIIGTDPVEAAGAILSENIEVYLNDVLLLPLQDYIYDGITKIITIDQDRISTGDILKIESNFGTEYNIVDNSIVIDPSVNLTENDEIRVTWFTRSSSLGIVSDIYTGGKINYELKFEPLSVDYIWVYKNGLRLTQDVEYNIDKNKNVVYLKDDTTENDIIRIVLFGNKIFKFTSAYEIYKDMLNIHHYKRYSKNTNVTLAKKLNYFDTTIEVTDASNLSDPVKNRNIPGLIEINNERIEYFSKNGNTLSQLRRGAYGTSINEQVSAGTSVINLGIEENIPYTEDQERFDFYSDGSSSIIGPLPFVPTKAEITNWYRDSIPNDYGQCNEIEVFVGGTRLRKSPIEIYKESLGPASPQADEFTEAEFSVDGESAEIRLTQNEIPAGTRISIIRKVGKTWYDRGENTITTGITLLENESAIAKFIAQKSTELPE